MLMVAAADVFVVFFETSYRICRNNYLTFRLKFMLACARSAHSKSDERISRVNLDWLDNCECDTHQQHPYTDKKNTRYTERNSIARCVYQLCQKSHQRANQMEKRKHNFNTISHVRRKS